MHWSWQLIRDGIPTNDDNISRYQDAITEMKVNNAGSRRPCTGTLVPMGSQIPSVPMGQMMTLQVRRLMAFLQAKHTYILYRRSFSSLFLYCFTLCTDALICWQGLCMTTRGTNLDTYHQTTTSISSLSSLWLYKAYPSNHVQNHYVSVETFWTFPSMNISI